MTPCYAAPACCAGCPSDRVAGAGCFGATMMLRPQLVADCCHAIAEASGLPVSVKCRIGVDNQDTYEQLHHFVQTVAEGSPVRHFIIHARKCLLQGLNPHQNRTVPPLRYEWVWALCRDFPSLRFSLNGGVQSLEEVALALALAPVGIAQDCTAGGCSSNGGSNEGASSSSGMLASGEGSRLEGVMIGRAAYHAPWDLLAGADVALFGAHANAAMSRRQVLQAYAAYADGMVGRWRSEPDGRTAPSIRVLVRPLLGLFHNEPHGKKWRAAVGSAARLQCMGISTAASAPCHVFHSIVWNSWNSMELLCRWTKRSRGPPALVRSLRRRCPSCSRRHSMRRRGHWVCCQQHWSTI